jgi:hypothetical protein
LNRWTLRRLGPDPDGGSGADIVGILFSRCGCDCADVFNVSLGSVALGFCMLVGCRPFLKMSLVAVWLIVGPAVVSVFEFVAAAAGCRSTVFSGWGVGLAYWVVRVLCSIGGMY